MNRVTRWRLAWIILLTLVLLPEAAQAVIERDYPLANAIADADFIVVAKIERVDAEKRTSIWRVSQVLHGKPDFQRMPVRLDGKKNEETAQLLERIAPEQAVVLFITESEDGKSAIATAFTNGTWFQVKGVEVSNGMKWQFTHNEPFLRRTFKGTTPELTQTVADVLAGKAKAPPTNPKEKPGLGPTLAEAAGK